ncbi:hypothetical protein RRG08_029608 [Elysia crispata]|uniref:Uncharacterized protein n=1 Tax=Elysia crispata TaxID=231223 RepID=A0AAE1CJL6_9GAST|nr:hypothetical protein RRG08_029608 [Elysia crispata]
MLHTRHTMDKESPALRRGNTSHKIVRLSFLLSQTSSHVWTMGAVTLFQRGCPISSRVCVLKGEICMGRAGHSNEQYVTPNTQSLTK